MKLLATNPILFKIKYVNGDNIDTTTGASAILGQAFHKAMEVYYGGSDTLVVTCEEDAIEYGLKAGMEFVENYNEGFINWSKTIPNKQKMGELLAFMFTSYVKERPYVPGEVVDTEDQIKERIDIEWRGDRVTLPIKLKGYIDKVTEVDGKLKLTDYKTCYTYSNPDKIDGSKILQAVVYYLLAYAKYGKAPYSMVFEEVKYTKNSDGSGQVRSYEIVYDEHSLFFDFFFRFYEDSVKALTGQMVFLPNLDAMYDNEVSIVAYINRLDIEEEAAKLLKKHHADTLTDLLKKQIQSSANMKKLMKSVEKDFVSAKNLNYAKMENQEKIQTKLLEHGMMLQFDSKLEGATVDLYRYTPSIGLKMARLKGYVADVEQVLGITGIRVLAPIPDTTLVGFEVPRKERTFPKAPKSDGFNIAIGEDIMGDVRRFDIRETPHMLVAGSSGSGKSVFLSSLINQLNKLPKKQVEMHLFDPKMVELAMHSEDKNVVEYESDIMAIHESLQDLVAEMNSRYKKLKQMKLRDISKADMPYKIVVVDEFGDLIVQNYIHVEYEKTGKIFQKGPREGEEETKKVETNISQEIAKNILLLAQKARAAGIHMVISTQRPSVDIITGSIKANFSTKVAFRTAKTIDSQIIIDEEGAEKLKGKGDCLFSSVDGIERLQGYMID